MKREELVQRLRAYSDRSARLTARLFAAFLLAFILLGAAVEYVPFLDKHFNLALIAVIVALWLFHYVATRRDVVICPACKSKLTGVLAPIATASGRCGRCGAPVLEESSV
jgi:hypothetical protein